MRKRTLWKLRTREVSLGERTLIMGVLNVTPDSFSDGGRYSDPDRALARVYEMEEQGADIIDIGAESTRPNSTRISEAEELRRLIPVLKRLQGNVQVPISVDTYKSGVAAKAIEHGAEIINDPSSLTFDPDLARVAAQHNAGLILNHMRGTPETWNALPPMRDVMATILPELDACIHRAMRANVERQRIVIDPGIGFGKRNEQNTEIIARLGELRTFDLPVLVGPSRKSFLAQTTEEGTRFATAAAVTVCVLAGADIVRVHDVSEMRVAAQFADAVLAARLERAERQANAADTAGNNASRAAPRQSAAPPRRMPGMPRRDAGRPGENAENRPPGPVRPRSPRPTSPSSRWRK